MTTIAISPAEVEPTIKPGSTLERMARADGWSNLFTGMGVAAYDKRNASQFARGYRFSQDQLESLYHEDDLVSTIVDVPADDMTRKWIELRTPGAASAGEEVRHDPEVAKRIMQEMEVLGLQERFADADRWASLHGGAILFLGVDDGQPPDMPLREDAIRSFKWATVLDRWEVDIAGKYTDPLSDKYDEPALYRINSALVGADGRAFGRLIHESRVLRFRGAPTSRRRREELAGWDESVIVKVYEIVRDFSSAFSGAAALLQDFAQAVFKIKGLAQAMAQDKEQLVHARMKNLNLSRSILRAVLLDADGESFERVPTPLAGYSDVLDRIMLRLSAAIRMPVTKLMGRSPAGMNATGESDERIWADHIETQQARRMRRPLERTIRLLMRSKAGPTRGLEPRDWSFDFCSLIQQSEKDKAETRKLVADTDNLMIMNGVVDPSEVRRSRYGGDRYSIDTMIDDTLDVQPAPAPTEGRQDPAAEPVDPNAEPAPDAADVAVPKTGALPADASTAFNGAQVSAMVEVVRATIAKEIPRESAIAILSTAFPITPEQAASMLGPKEFEAAPKDEAKDPPPKGEVEEADDEPPHDATDDEGEDDVDEQD